MSNRFEKLYSLSGQLYAPSSPVIITAGALLKDTQTGKVLAQLKFKNINSKVIKAVTVSLLPRDTADQPLGEKETHQILDLAANRDNEFGQKTPLYFSNNTTRAYQIIVEEVVFSDNTVWKTDGTPLSELPVQKAASETLVDVELEKQYKSEYGERANYMADTCFDLWRCHCGAINRSDEQVCHICSAEKSSALSVSIVQLKKACQIRLEEERKEAEQASIQNGLRKKKTIKIGIICCVLAVIAYFVMTIAVPKIEHHAELNRKIGLLNEAVSFLNSEDYSSAESILDKMDSEDSLNAAKYEQAVSFFETGKYIQAITLFERTSDYGDSADYLIKSASLAAESYYQQGNYRLCVNLCESRQVYPDVYRAACYYYALSLKESENYSDAVDYFDRADGYLDSTELKQSCKIDSDYSLAISYMYSRRFTDAINLFTSLDNYKSSQEYLSLCNTYAKYNGWWLCKGHSAYDLNIEVLPLRSGDILYEVNGEPATLNGSILSYEHFGYSCTFNLSTGVGHLTDGNRTEEFICEKYEK